jgi:hypothetical protein
MPTCSEWLQHWAAVSLPERQLTGVLLTVLVVFLVDNFAVANAPSGTEPQKIVNWDVAVQKLRSSSLGRLPLLNRGCGNDRQSSEGPA